MSLGSECPFSLPPMPHRKLYIASGNWKAFERLATLHGSVGMASVDPVDVTWAQDRFAVHLRIHAADARDLSLQLVDSKKIVVLGTSGITDKPFRVQLDLAFSVEKPSGLPKATPQYASLALHKKKTAEWEKLTTGAGTTGATGVRTLSYSWDMDNMLARQAEALGVDDLSSDHGSDSEPSDIKSNAAGAPPAQTLRHTRSTQETRPSAPPAHQATELPGNVNNISIDDRRPPRVPAKRVRAAHLTGWSTAAVLAVAVGAFGCGIATGGVLLNKLL
jgi:hypothetical protein